MQITRSRPWRRMIWQRSQRFLIEADTFIAVPRRLSYSYLLVRSSKRSAPVLPEAVRDTPARQVVRAEFHQYSVTQEDADVVHLHPPGDVCQNVVPVGEFDIEHRVGQRVLDDAFDLDDFLFRLRARAAFLRAADLVYQDGMLVIAVAPDATVLHANLEAEDLLRRGAALRRIAGKLSAHQSREDAMLQRLIRRACQTSAQPETGAMRVGQDGTWPLTLTVGPLSPRSTSVAVDVWDTTPTDSVKRRIPMP